MNRPPAVIHLIIAILMNPQFTYAMPCAELLSPNSYHWGIEQTFLPVNKKISDLMSEESIQLAEKNALSFTVRDGQLITTFSGENEHSIALPGPIKSIQIKKVYIPTETTYLSVVTQTEILPFVIAGKEISKIKTNERPSEVNDGILTWEISKFRQEPGDRKNPTDPETVYLYEIKTQGQVRTKASITYQALLPLLKKLNYEDQPGKMKGLRINSPVEKGADVLDYQIVRTGYGRSHSPPSSERLYQSALDSFAKLELPQFDDWVDRTTLSSAFSSAFHNARWLNLLNEKLSKQTEGRVSLLEWEPRKPKTIIKYGINKKNPDVRYFKLVSGTHELKFTFSPSGKPFKLDQFRN